MIGSPPLQLLFLTFFFDTAGYSGWGAIDTAPVDIKAVSIQDIEPASTPGAPIKQSIGNY